MLRMHSVGVASGGDEVGRLSLVSNSRPAVRVRGRGSAALARRGVGSRGGWKYGRRVWVRKKQSDRIAQTMVHAATQAALLLVCACLLVSGKMETAAGR